MADESTARHTSDVYRDVFGGWRWEAHDPKGQPVDSRLSFSSIEDCMRDAERAGYTISGNTERRGLCVLPEGNCKQMLENAFAGDKIVFAHTAYDALRNLHAGVFDYYVLEYWLPDLSGVSLCREIRKIDPAAPVIFCAASARDDARRRGLNAGANAYICLPVEAQVLRERMRLLIDRTDAESLLAKREEKLAIDAELVRRSKAAANRAGQAMALAAGATERAARAKAYRAFMESRGTRANFDRWWPQVSSSAWAAYRSREHEA